ncbi:MAG TPA: hypothetical protein VF267_10430 [Gammaproteobacteria bacterium]
MSQQVNLYQPILRREKKVFSASTMLQTLGALSLVMLAIFAVSRWQLEELQNERARLQAQERELVEKVTTVSRELDVRPESRELRRQVELARRELAMKQRLAALMQDRPVSESGGFADAFEGLARRRVNGLWLTGIELQQNEQQRNVVLRGRTARAELVPELVQQLGGEPAFQGLRFQHLRVYQPEAGPANTLAFELATRLPKEDEK